MREQTLKKEILKLALREYPQWLNGGQFERLAMELMYKASNASRRCRELYNEGKLERRENERGCVEYQWVPEKELSDEEILKISVG